MKKQLGSSNAIFPVPASLVVSGRGEDANIITIAWIGIVSATPPTVGISIKRSRYSLGKIRDLGEFTVNIPSADYFQKVDYCGMTTGRKRNKFKDTGFTPMKSIKIRTPIIKECPYNMECKISREIDVGDWVLILGEILETHVDEDKFDLSKTAKIDISKVNPLVYCAKVREYWSMGDKLGYGFDAGKELIKGLK